MKPGPIGSLTGIWAISGTAEDGPKKFRGFCTVRAEAEGGGELIGQLPPDELRAMALHWLSCAEAADQDAIVMTLLVRDVGVPVPVAARLVAAMRDERPEPKGH